MTAPDVYEVPKAYVDPAGNAYAKGILQADAWASIDLAMQGKTEAQTILLDWALHCREVQGSEANLVMTFKGVSMLEAWLVMKQLHWNKEVFRIWVERVYRPCAEQEQRESWFPLLDEQNNRAAWGILGCILSDIILDKDVTQWNKRINRKLDCAVAANGKMKIETQRTNMGIWYAVFDLTAMLRACQLVPNSPIDRLVKPLTWLWQYIKDPDSWPYLPGKWPLAVWPWPKVEKIIHPTSTALDRPRANDEAGALYLAAGKQFGVQEWIDYAQPWPDGCTPFPGCNEFRWIKK